MVEDESAYGAWNEDSAGNRWRDVKVKRYLGLRAKVELMDGTIRDDLIIPIDLGQIEGIQFWRPASRELIGMNGKTITILPEGEDPFPD